MNTDSKHTEWILETIDHLRRRKARPDLQRICHVVRRNFGLQATDTEAKLEKLVDAEIVIKVDYKGSTSYRNAAKWRKSMLGCAVQNSKKVSTKIIEAVLEITKSKSKKDDPPPEQNIESKPSEDESALEQTESTRVSKTGTENGASFKEINTWLDKHYDGYKHLKSPLTIVLKREVDAGRIRKLEDGGTFVLTDEQKNLIKNDVITIADFIQRADPSNQSSVPVQHFNFNGKHGSLPSHQRSPAVKLGIQNGHQPTRRGRPPKCRPSLTSPQQMIVTSNNSNNIHKPSKLKRSGSTAFGGDPKHSHPAKVLKTEPHNESDICDMCHLTSNSSGKGHPEILLHCSDCPVKAHPSCLKYNSVLASRACKGPWQCTDCKTCCVCHDSGQPDQMLFCDGCDKGYHMTCHQPSVLKKPSGLWECYECRLENSSLQRSEFFAMHSQRSNEVQDSAPPTPAESPEPSSLHQNRTIYPDASEWTVSDVVEYFSSAGFSQEAQIFKEQEIDGIAVLLLRRTDVLKGLDLKLGPALKINRLVEGLQTAKQHIS